MTTAAAGWHRDPAERFEYRYWDGAVWTEHVSKAGILGVDQLGSPPPASSVVAQVPLARSPATSSLSTADHFMFVQVSKRVEVSNRYNYLDSQGQLLGQALQVDQGASRKIFRAISRHDQYLSQSFEIHDTASQALYQVDCPATFTLKTFEVADARGRRFGRIAQATTQGRAAFTLETHGSPCGAIASLDVIGHSLSLMDASEAELARITRTGGERAKGRRSSVDQYQVQVRPGLADPFRSLVIAAPLVIDLVLNSESERSPHRWV